MWIRIPIGRSLHVCYFDGKHPASSTASNLADRCRPDTHLRHVCASMPRGCFTLSYGLIAADCVCHIILHCNHHLYTCLAMGLLILVKAYRHRTWHGHTYAQGDPLCKKAKRLADRLWRTALGTLECQTQLSAHSPNCTRGLLDAFRTHLLVPSLTLNAHTPNLAELCRTQMLNLQVLHSLHTCECTY